MSKQGVWRKEVTGEFAGGISQSTRLAFKGHQLRLGLPGVQTFFDWRIQKTPGRPRPVFLQVN